MAHLEHVASRCEVEHQVKVVQILGPRDHAQDVGVRQPRLDVFLPLEVYALLPGRVAQFALESKRVRTAVAIRWAGHQVASGGGVGWGGSDAEGGGGR